jgi:hypothetical protein
MSSSSSFREEVDMMAAMFEGMDRAVIQSVFQTNNFNVERTIDNLLALNSTDTPPARPKNTNDSTPISSSLAEARALHARRQAAEKKDAQKGSGSTTESSGDRSTKKWRNPLPDDFLRLPRDFIPTSGGSNAPPSMLRDEELARMLQNEIFREQLHADPLFHRLMAQERDAAQDRARRQHMIPAASGGGSGGGDGGSSGTATANKSSESGNWFSGMGDSLKQFISSRYRHRRSRTAEGHRLLAADDDDDDEDAQGRRNSDGTEIETEVPPLFDEEADDGSGAGFEMGSLSRSNSIQKGASSGREEYSYEMGDSKKNDNGKDYNML